MSNSSPIKTNKSSKRRILGSLGFLVRGRGIAAIMSAGSSLIMARSLGPSAFGLIMLTLANTLLIRVFFDFQLFESIVRYGVQAQEAKNTTQLRRLISLCWRIDRRISLASTLLALAIAPLVGIAMDLTYQQIMILTAYSLVLLSTGNGTAIGILRLFDRFDRLGKVMTFGPTIRLLGVVIAWWFDASLMVFVLVVGVAYVIENLSLSWYGWLEYKDKIGIAPKVSQISDVKMSEFKGLKSFLWVTYWQSNLDVAPKHSMLLLAGLLLGTAEVGLLRLAREFSTILSNPATLIRQVLFLDLTRSWHQKRADFKSLTYQTALFGAAIGSLFVLASYFFGEILLQTLVGKEFITAAPLLTLLLLASTFELTASSLRSAAYAIGHADRVLKLSILSAVVYIVLFAWLVWWVGLIGAGIAAAFSSVVAPLVIFVIVYNSRLELAEEVTESKD